MSMLVAHADELCHDDRALRATTSGWKDTDTDKDHGHGQQEDDLAAGFSMRALTGGMTNAVFRCSKASGHNRTVLLRSYGNGTEASHVGLGPT